MPLDISGLQNYRNGLAGARDRGSYRTAEDVLSLQQDLTPVDSGDLKGSEHIEPEQGSGNGQYSVVAGDGEEVDYAAFVEDDQPFAAPAAKRIRPGLRVAQEIRALAKQSRIK